MVLLVCTSAGPVDALKVQSSDGYDYICATPNFCVNGFSKAAILDGLLFLLLIHISQFEVMFIKKRLDNA